MESVIVSLSGAVMAVFARLMVKGTGAARKCDDHSQKFSVTDWRLNIWNDGSGPALDIVIESECGHDAAPCKGTHRIHVSALGFEDNREARIAFDAAKEIVAAKEKASAEKARVMDAARKARESADTLERLERAGYVEPSTPNGASGPERSVASA